MKAFNLALLGFFFALYSFNITYSQNFHWSTHWDVNDYDQGLKVKLGGSDYIYVLGTNPTYSECDYILIKYDDCGDTLWVRKFNGSGNSVDWAQDLNVQIVGGLAGDYIYITGGSYINDTDQAIVTLKYNASGVLQWTATYSVLDERSMGKYLVVDNSGNVYFTGIKNIANDQEIITIKYNSSGVQQWVVTENYVDVGEEEEMPVGIKVDDDGRVYVAGWYRSSSLESDYVLIQYVSGAKEWDEIYDSPYGGNSLDKSIDIEVDANDVVYITGTSLNSGGTINEFTTLAYDNDGSNLWTSRYSSGNGGYALDMKLDNSGHVLVTGYMNSNTTHDDFATVKYATSNGGQNWAVTYSSSTNSGSDWAYEMFVDGSDNVYVAGQFAINGYDFGIIKYNSSGAQQWVNNYNRSGSSDDGAKSIVVTSGGKAFLTGYSTISTDKDITTVKFASGFSTCDDDNNLSISNTEKPKEFNLMQNYPNPFNPVTTIRFDIAQTGFAKLVIFDILGREVSTAVSDILKAGEYRVSFNASSLPSGVYFYRLTVTNDNTTWSATKKLMLVK